MFKKDFDSMRNILKERSRSSGTEETWRIRCLPYFYLIGMPRSGSTDLTYSIGFHPYVIRSRLKEFKYWNRARLQHPAVQLRNYPHELRHYVETFDYMGEISRNFTKGFTRQEYPYHPMILGDESPSYMFDFDAWEQLDVHKGLSEPRFTTAHYIKQLTPRAKFIITLRNPADRLFSDYKAFYTTQHKTARDFDELVRVNINLFNNCTKTRTVRACAYSYNSTLPFQPVRPRVGIYYIYLVDWFATYPRDQFYITRLEDFAEKKSAVASEIFEFLELPPVSDDILFEIDKDTVHNTAVQRSGKGTTVGELLMWDSTKKIIQDFYRPWNDKLVQLLGDDKYSFS
ncbi:hypothetical protein CAPTEDRAFT_150358 [Capitella teleta]|uniref:Sulfotransferase domain-containing protein n=1 Tax=Capitella teleta TaxID=283909 RepID=R7TFR4_CAPTE|nr:hypothetical protein CAPTEDRAFT_150358 [Capitella teleta]|eukprot:ELT90371.1 hypothetical protein CAPTEDRAFT_150358 [Capitella teleta]